MKHTWLKILPATLCLFLLLTACGEKDKAPDQTHDPAPTNTVTTDAPGETDEPKDYSKYNTYVDLADEMAEMEEILNVYFNNVAYQGEFELLDGGDYANIKDVVRFYTGMSYTLEKALDYATTEPSYPQMDAAILALGKSPAQVMTALNHLGSYMRFDDFVDDDLARAPEIHEELWAALEIYDAHYADFLNALSDMAEQGREDDLAELLAAGELIRYNTRQMIQTAEDIQDGIWIQLEAAAAEADPDEALALPPIDMTNLSPLFAKFQTAYDDLTAALENEEEQEKISAFTGKTGESSLQIYTRRVDALYVKMGTLAQAIMEGNDYAKAYDETSEAVSNMISTYNNVN